jgi:methyl-accepting chemotaxis protein
MKRNEEKKMKLKKKIILSSLPASTLLITLSFISIYGIITLTKSNHLVDHTHVVIQETMQIEGAAVDMETGMRGYLLAGKEEFLEPYNNGVVLFEDKIEKLKLTVSDNPQQVQLLDEIHNTIKEWNEEVVRQAIELRSAVGDSKTMDDIAELVGKAKGKTYFDKFRSQVKTFKDREQILMKARQEKTDAIGTQSIIAIIICGIGAIVIAVLISYFVAGGIIKPVKQVVEGLRDMAEGEGDLTKTIEIKSKDEVGELADWFNQFVSSLRAIIRQIADTTRPLQEASERLAIISTQMASSAEEMTSQATMVAASSEEVSTSVSMVAAASEQTSTSVANIASMTEEMSSTFNQYC